VEWPTRETESDFPRDRSDVLQEGVAITPLPGGTHGTKRPEEIQHLSDEQALKKHQTFENAVRKRIVEELSKETVKSLRDGFAKVLWKDQDGMPLVQQLVDSLFRPDEKTGRRDPHFMLETLRRATEICLANLEDGREAISENHRVWKCAKLILGWLVTLAVRAERLGPPGSDVFFDEVELETATAVEVFTARKKELPANFKGNHNHGGGERYLGANQIDCFFPEVGLNERDAIEQIWLIVWKAAGNPERNTPLTGVELEKLRSDIKLRGTRLTNPVHYFLSIRKTAKNHPLLNPEICRQIRRELPDLTIVHLVSASGAASVLMIGEGVLCSYIEEFLSLINQYQGSNP
jgi:hypothetical protein